jgi:hypothetical protein
MLPFRCPSSHLCRNCPNAKKAKAKANQLLAVSAKHLLVPKVGEQNDFFVP